MPLKQAFAVLLIGGLLATTLILNPARKTFTPTASSPRTFPSDCGLTSTPCLIIASSVDDGFAGLAAETWSSFLTAFAARTDCFGDVHLQASYQLPARAGYDPATATVTVRVPGSAAKLRAALIHEWAHHIEFQCPEQRTMRPAFLAAEGFPPGAPWRPEHARVTSSIWAEVPSEHYAEAAIEFVLGHNATPTQIHVQRAAVDALAAWARGGDQSSAGLHSQP